MGKRASIASAIGWGLKKSAPALAVGTAVGGSVAGVRAISSAVKHAPLADDKTTGYQKHIAKNLRTGNMTVNNLSQFDQGTARNMYKISSLEKQAFMSAVGKLAMPALTVGMLPGEAKANTAKFQLKAPQGVGQQPNLDSRNYKFGIDNK